MVPKLSRVVFVLGFAVWGPLFPSCVEENQSDGNKTKETYSGSVQVRDCGLATHIHCRHHQIYPLQLLGLTDVGGSVF